MRCNGWSGQKNRDTGSGGEQAGGLHGVQSAWFDHARPLVIKAVLDGLLQETLLDEGRFFTRVQLHGGDEPAVETWVAGFDPAGQQPIVRFDQQPQGRDHCEASQRNRQPQLEASIRKRASGAEQKPPRPRSQH